MTMTIHELSPGALELTVHGKLRKDDYEHFVHIAESQMQAHGKIGILIRLADMQGWSPAALWEDIKFDVKHYRDVSRFAIVGEDSSKAWMATVSEPFTAAEVQFYPERELELARNWVQGLDPHPAGARSHTG